MRNGGQIKCARGQASKAKWPNSVRKRGQIRCEYAAGGKKNIYRHLEKMRSLILKNVESEKSTADAEQLTEMIGMFFAGLALMENSGAAIHSDESVKIFMDAIKNL